MEGVSEAKCIREIGVGRGKMEYLLSKDARVPRPKHLRYSTVALQEYEISAKQYPSGEVYWNLT